MTIFCFKDTPGQDHHVQKRPASLRVDGVDLRLRALSPNAYIAPVGAGQERVYAIAHGDTVHVHMNGQAWQIERPDPTRASSAGAQGGGGSRAPMPGVVVSWLVQPGSAVRNGDALLVIESMKLQMTIEAHQDGVLDDLPFMEGQTFDRGALLARIRGVGDTA